MCELVLIVVGITVQHRAADVLFARYIAIAVVGILPRQARKAVVIAQLRHLIRSRMQGRIISREKQAVLVARAVDRAAARTHRLSRQLIQAIVAVRYLHARRVGCARRADICIPRIVYPKLGQQSGCIAVSIRLARCSRAVIPCLTRQTVRVVIDMLCALVERAVVILAAADKVLYTPEGLSPPGGCFL